MTMEMAELAGKLPSGETSATRRSRSFLANVVDIKCGRVAT